MTSRATLQPSDLGLILSYHCQCECAHCLYNCGSSWSEWMSFDAVESALGSTLVWERPFQVHLTGGEPFINFPLLLHAVQVASRFELPCYVETNAGWCVREDLVIDRFSKLRENGLQAVLISCSPFHAAAIPLKRTLMAIAVALEIFGPHGVIVYQIEWLDQLRRFGFEHPTPLNHYIESYGLEPAGVMFWEGYSLISGGRSGYRLGYLVDRRPAAAFRKANCRSEILKSEHSHFDLYGNFIPGFCGGVSLGAWHDLPHLLENYSAGNYPPLLATLIQSGPFGLYEFAGESYGYRSLPGGYAGKCHLCVDVRRCLVQTGDFIELQPLKFYEIME